jgi:hypothetical protein
MRLTAVDPSDASFLSRARLYSPESHLRQWALEPIIAEQISTSRSPDRAVNDELGGSEAQYFEDIGR